VRGFSYGMHSQNRINGFPLNSIMKVRSEIEELKIKYYVRYRNVKRKLKSKKYMYLSGKLP
jgi:hypothetical protein